MITGALPKRDPILVVSAALRFSPGPASHPPCHDTSALNRKSTAAILKPTAPYNQPISSRGMPFWKVPLEGPHGSHRRDRSPSTSLPSGTAKLISFHTLDTGRGNGPGWLVPGGCSPSAQRQCNR